MLKNYLKIAWAVLLRRKFFTFISLFGISFTLMVLMVVASLLHYTLGAHVPETHPDRLLYFNNGEMKGKNSMTAGSLSYFFLEKYVRPLQTPVDMTFCSLPLTGNTYRNGQKMEIQQRYTDGHYWQVLQFDFLEGQPYTLQEVKNASRVAVINQSTRKAYFGQEPALGKYIDLGGEAYRVVGVVADVPAIRFNTSADAWIPVTTGLSTFAAEREGYFGSFFAILLASSPDGVTQVKEEFFARARKIPILEPKEYDTLILFLDTLPETVVHRYLASSNEPISLSFYVGLFIVAILLFMLLPTVNLANINITRIMERASEIGVRKAFGASSRVLVGQFLVENLLLTLLGGALGLLLTVGALSLINQSGFIPYAQFRVNFPVFLISMAVCVFFGVMSGVYPALKMSKLPAVAALKGGAR